MENTKPLVSIIIPVYKAENYLDRCLKSVVNQTYRNLEIILVDDGSPDKCPEICDEYAKSDERIKVIHKQNAGVSAARNDGLAFANGDLIGFVDSDDVLHPSMYEEMVNYLVFQDCDFVSCGFSEFSEDDIHSDIDLSSYRKETLKRNAAIRKSFEKNNKFIKYVWSLLIKAEVAKSVKFDCSLAYGEDTKYAYEVIMKTMYVGFIYAPLYNYFKNESGASSLADSKKFTEVLYLFYDIYLSVCTICDKATKKEAYSFFLRIFSHNIFLVNKRDLKKLRGLIFKNIFGILRSPDIYWKEKILILLKLL